VSLFLRISKFFLTYSHSRLVTEVQLYLSVVCDVCIYEQLVFFDKSIEPPPGKLKIFYPLTVAREIVELFFPFCTSDLKKHTKYDRYRYVKLNTRI